MSHTWWNGGLSCVAGEGMDVRSCCPASLLHSPEHLQEQHSQPYTAFICMNFPLIISLPKVMIAFSIQTYDPAQTLCVIYPELNPKCLFKKGGIIRALGLINLGAIISADIYLVYILIYTWMVMPG